MMGGQGINPIPIYIRQRQFLPDIPSTGPQRPMQIDPTTMPGMIGPEEVYSKDDDS